MFTRLPSPRMGSPGASSASSRWFDSAPLLACQPAHRTPAGSACRAACGLPAAPPAPSPARLSWREPAVLPPRSGGCSSASQGGRSSTGCKLTRLSWGAQDGNFTVAWRAVRDSARAADSMGRQVRARRAGAPAPAARRRCCGGYAPTRSLGLLGSQPRRLLAPLRRWRLLFFRPYWAQGVCVRHRGRGTCAGMEQYNVGGGVPALLSERLQAERRRCACCLD